MPAELYEYYGLTVGHVVDQARDLAREDRRDEQARERLLDPTGDSDRATNTTLAAPAAACAG